MTKSETVIEDIVNAMTPYLRYDQMEHLRDTLYIKFKGLKIEDESTAITPSQNSEDELMIKMFIASKRAINRSSNTLVQYERQIKRALAFIGKHIKDITAMDIRFYFGSLREKNNVSSVTIQDYQRYLNSFFDFLLTEGYISSNPIRQVGPVKIDKTIKKPFSSEEMEKLRSACINDRNRALMEILYSTGLRVSELVSLNISNVNFTSGEVIVLGKGKKERRTYISEAAMFYLKKYLQTRISEEDFVNSPLFTMSHSYGKRMTISAVEQMLKRLGNAAGVEDVHPHRFRRTIATDLLSRGMPLEQVKEFLGHENVDTTMLYCTVSEEQVRSSHKKFA